MIARASCWQFFVYEWSIWKDGVMAYVAAAACIPLPRSASLMAACRLFWQLAASAAVRAANSFYWNIKNMHRRHRQRQRDDGHRQAGAKITAKTLGAVAAQAAALQPRHLHGIWKGQSKAARNCSPLFSLKYAGAISNMVQPPLFPSLARRQAARAHATSTLAVNSGLEPRVRRYSITC